MNDEFYLSVDTQNGLKRLFKFTSEQDGSVYITSASNPRIIIDRTLPELLNLSEDDYPKSSKFSKISLHSTKDEDYNQINFEGVGRKTLFTKALKAENKFAPIVIRSVGNLNDSKHDITSQKLDRHVLPFIDTSKDTLVLGLVIGPKDKEFEKIDDHPSNLLKFEAEDFTVWIIWSLFNEPALAPSVDFKFKGGNKVAHLPGFENFEIYNAYTFLKSLFTDSYYEQFPERNFR